MSIPTGSALHCKGATCMLNGQSECQSNIPALWSRSRSSGVLPVSIPLPFSATSISFSLTACNNIVLDINASRPHSMHWKRHACFFERQQDVRTNSAPCYGFKSLRCPLNSNGCRANNLHRGYKISDMLFESSYVYCLYIYPLKMDNTLAVALSIGIPFMTFSWPVQIHS